MQENRDLAVFGFVLLLPALLACLCDPLRISAQNPLLHPTLVLGGLAAALLLNAVPILGWDIRREEDRLRLTIVLEFKGRLPNLTVMGVSLLLLMVDTLSLFWKNFQPH